MTRRPLLLAILLVVALTLGASAARAERRPVVAQASMVVTVTVVEAP